MAVLIDNWLADLLHQLRPWAHAFFPIASQAFDFRGAPIYGPPVVVAPPPPTDAQVIAGTILGIAGLAIDVSMYRRH